MPKAAPECNRPLSHRLIPPQSPALAAHLAENGLNEWQIADQPSYGAVNGNEKAQGLRTGFAGWPIVGGEPIEISRQTAIWVSRTSEPRRRPC
jgi:hypothetical protein